MDLEMHNRHLVLGGGDLHRSDPGSGGTAASVASDSTSNQVTRTILLVEDEPSFVKWLTKSCVVPATGC